MPEDLKDGAGSGTPAATPPPAAEPSSAIADAAGSTATPPTPPAAVVATPPDDELAAKLKEFGATNEVVAAIREQLGAAIVADLALLTEADLIGVGMKAIPARNLLKNLAPAPTEVASGMMTPGALDDVLPAVMSDESWLSALRAGGVLKVDQSTVISAVRAALAHKAGLFDIPVNLATKMEAFADANEEQVDPEFFKLRKQLTRRSYAEVFEAIDGLDGNFVTEARKKQLFQRIDAGLWPAINAFQSQLKGWQEAWMGAGNQMAMVSMMTSLVAGMAGGGAALPPGLMQPPDTGGLRDQADAMADAVNKVFAGTGAQIASALAYEASTICETLSSPRLPSLIGAANRDQMLRQLGVAIPATYTRLETNLTRFVLSVMQVKDVPAGMEEIRFFSAIYMLGTQIPWDQLGGSVASGPIGIGGRTRSEL